MSTDNPYQLSARVKAELRAWWASLHSENSSGQARADRAALRRAADLDAVACTPAYQRLYQRLLRTRDGAGRPSFQRERLAAVVGLLAHVKTNTDKTLPQAMSTTQKGEKNPVSELRFRRLLESPDADALFVGLRRTLPLIQGEVSVMSLADDVFNWGQVTKKRWAYDYQWPDKTGD